MLSRSLIVSVWLCCAPSSFGYEDTCKESASADGDSNALLQSKVKVKQTVHDEANGSDITQQMMYQNVTAQARPAFEVGRNYAPVAALNDSANLLTNGAFEDGWSNPWKFVSAGQSGLPGWTVTHGNIDFGNYITGGHCSEKCAGEGESFLDICGWHKGGIAQTFATIPGTTYVLSLLYDSHVGCGGTETKSKVSLSSGDMSTSLDQVSWDTTLTHINDKTWNLKWTPFHHTFTAASSQTTLRLDSEGNKCGCMLFDDVAVKHDLTQAPTEASTCPSECSNKYEELFDKCTSDDCYQCPDCADGPEGGLS